MRFIVPLPPPPPHLRVRHLRALQMRHLSVQRFRVRRGDRVPVGRTRRHSAVRRFRGRSNNGTKPVHGHARKRALQRGLRGRVSQLRGLPVVRVQGSRVGSNLTLLLRVQKRRVLLHRELVSGMAAVQGLVYSVGIGTALRGIRALSLRVRALRVVSIVSPGIL